MNPESWNQIKPAMQVKLSYLTEYCTSVDHYIKGDMPYSAKVRLQQLIDVATEMVDTIDLYADER